MVSQCTDILLRREWGETDDGRYVCLGNVYKKSKVWVLAGVLWLWEGGVDGRGCGFGGEDYEDGEGGWKEEV